jgi:mycofactocin precursor
MSLGAVNLRLGSDDGIQEENVLMLEPTTATDDRELDAAPDDTSASEADAPLVDEDLLVEDVSIDGMCGVY